MNEDLDGSIESKAVGRFEKVLRTYWDGVPTPLFIADPSVNNTNLTFVLRLLGYSPDYHGETTDVSFCPVTCSDFCALSSVAHDSSPSTRIGNHYSPYVGTFSFVERKKKLKNERATQKTDTLANNNARIPQEACEQYTVPDKFTPYREFVRMEKVVELYEPLVREYFPLPRDTLRRIIIAATMGLGLQSKEWIVKEVASFTDESTRWMSQSIYYYMCMSPLFRRVLEPLDARTEADRHPYQVLILEGSDRLAARESSLSARQSLLASLRWGRNTTGLFTALKVLWDTRFAPLAFFNLSLDQTVTNAEDFVAQLSDSMRAAFTRLRLEFYTQAEDFFFAYIPDSRKSLFMSEEEMKTSHFNTVFTAMRIFLQSNLRTSLLQAFAELLRFFDCDGLRGSLTTERIALKHPLLKVDLVVGENYLPRSPQFARLVLGLMELFDAAIEYANRMPQLDVAILRTLKLENRPLTVLREDDLAEAKSSLANILDEVTLTMDSISAAYAAYSALPIHELSTSFLTNSDAIEAYTTELRGSYDAVKLASPDLVYCGTVVVDSSAVKQEYCANWERTLHAFYRRLYAMVKQSVCEAEEKVNDALEKVAKSPATVKELEIFLANIADAAALATSLRAKYCTDVIRTFECMEQNQIPIDPDLYEMALKLMQFPAALDRVVAKAGSAREDCRPLLLEKLKQLRKETRDNMQTLSTGITELYNMFNFDICDIAAQTCSELRELVEQINATVKNVFYQEDALNVKTVDTFEDLEPLLTAFETIEQYWSGVYRSTTLREYYNSPVRSIDADRMIDNARDWRRQIHAATRQVRAYPALVRLGRQQELTLANFEALEDLLRLITTPGLKKSHWKEIVRYIAAKLKDDTALAVNMGLPLQKLIDAGIANHLPEIARIAAQARNDYDVENTLETMKSVAKKTHFQVVDWPVGFLSRQRVSTDSFKSILSMVEDFVMQCHAMRQKTGVSSLVMGMLTEWEVATEKTRDIILVWLQVEDQWDLMFPVLQNLAVAKNKDAGTVWPAVEGKLSLVRDAFQSLYQMVGKPQFSLYTAVVQESISDFLLSAKSTMSDVAKMLPDALEQKRSAYPRFYFLTDSQLMTFLSPNNVDSLECLLPFMFSHLSGVCIEDGAVTAFVTDNGASLQATQPVPITEEPVEDWMRGLEKTLRDSLLTSVRQCLTAKSTTPVSVWISQFCAQTVELALRIEHTRAMRAAVRLGGTGGLTAHRTQLKDLRDELVRLSHKTGLSKSQKVVIAAGVVYLKHAVSEVEHAVANHISSVSDLDVTSMLQTFLADDTIHIRFLGITCEYGFEFVGDHVHPMLSVVVETSLSVMTQIWLGRTAPVLSGQMKKESVLAFISTFLGRFVLTVQGNSTLTTTATLPLLRGCMQHGALLCVYACETLAHELFVLLRECSEKVGNALLLEKADPSTTIPVGPGGSTVSVPLSTHYGLVFCTHDYGTVPRSLSFYFRPVYVPPLQTTEVVRAYLDAFGVAEATDDDCQGFATMCGHFAEMDASTFSHRNFILLLVYACTHSELGSPLERLCGAFAHVFYSFLQNDQELLSLFEWHLRHSFKGDTDGLSRRLSTLLTERPHDITTRFETMMESCHNVILVGPAFSGKSTMWRRHVGSSPFVAICPSLMSAEEFYGTPERAGLLTTIAKRRPLKAHARRFIVMTETDISQCDWWLTWPTDARVLSAEADYLGGPSTHLIITTETVAHMTPKVACDFVVFYLPHTTDWQRFLHRCLRGAPHPDVAMKLISTLLPILCKARPELSADGPDDGVTTVDGRGDGGASLNFKDPSFLATCQHCAGLYRRWYTYTQRQTIVESYFDDLLADPRLFAAQCATFAVCWTIGLGLPPSEQAHLTAALREAESTIAEAMAAVNVHDRVLPPLAEQDPSVLHLLCTPRGWKTFEQAGSCGFDFQWTTFSQASSAHPPSAPIFATPSRQPTLAALQCLVDCGQNVVVTGLEGSGKSTLLSLTRLREQWVTLPVSANRGFSATSVQRAMADRLLLRSSGVHGPQPGRRLVVCIDDVHLCPLVRPATPAASQLIAYCSSLSAICDPSQGFVPFTDVGFLATMRQSTSPSASPSRLNVPIRFCTSVHLPMLNPDELADGLWKLFDAACQKKRVAEMPRACNSFLVSAHAAFLRALGPSSSLPLTPDVPDAATCTAAAGSEALDCFGMVAESCLPHYFKKVMAVADAARHQLLTAAPDVTVALNITTTTADMYTTVLREQHTPDSARQQLTQDLAVCATQSFGSVLRTTPAILKVNLDVATQDHAEELPTKEESNKIAEWIAEFELPGNALCETRLEFMYARSAPTPFGSAVREDEMTSVLLFVRSTVASGGTDGSGGSQANSRSGSVVASATARSNSVGANGRQGASRRSSASGRRGSVSRRGSLTRRSSLRSLRGSVQLDTGTLSQGRSAVLSPTVQTVWLTRQLITLSRLLQHSESHATLIGAGKYGYRRLLRILCHHTHLPLAVLCQTSGYCFSTFLQDVKTIITFACQNDSRTVIYVPEPILHLPGVARVVDGIIANGDISDLFTKAERLALHRGFAVNTTKSLRTLTLAEDADLRRRVRRGVSFVLQVGATETWSTLVEGYPVLQSVSTVHTTSASHWKRSKEELVSAALYGDDVEPAMVEQPLEAELRRCGGQLKLRGKTLIRLLCDIYNAVAEDYPVVLEQLAAFAQQVRRFRAVEQVAIQRDAFSTRAISTRGDTATVEMNNCIEQRKAAAKECTDTQNQAKKLKSRLVREEDANNTFQKSAKEAETQLQEEEAQLRENEAVIREAQDRADEAVATAAARLRRIKGTQLRSMRSMRLPEKGVLLIRAVYKVLGQELPKHNGPTDLWFTAANIMSETSFVNAVASLDPGRIVDVGPLLGTLREIGEVRYDKVFPYGQLLADFVVAYIESARTRIIVNAPLLETLEAERVAFDEMRRDVEGLYSKARSVLETASETQQIIAELDTRVVTLTKLQASLDQRVKRLSRYVGAVDRLTSFLTASEMADKTAWAATAEADCILLAAFSTLLAPHHNTEAVVPRIQAILKTCGVACSSDVSHTFTSLLTGGNPAHMTTFMSLNTLPRRHQLALALLYQRASPTWMLIGGVCPTFEQKVVEVTRLRSRGCTVVSAFEGYLPDRLTQCMRDGEGVVLRDVFTPSGFSLMHQLDPLRLKLREWRESLARDRGQQQQGGSHHTTSGESKTVRMPFRIFGRDVEVHPDFYVVATSAAPVPVRDGDKDTAMPTVTKWLTLLNLYVPVARSTRYEHLLLRMPAPKNITDDLQEVRTRLHHEMEEYRVTYSAAAMLVSQPLEQLATSGDAAVDAVESTILDFEFHFNQIAQLQTQSHNIRKRQHDDWACVTAPLNAFADVIGFLEQEKIGRLWGDQVLDVLIRRMPALSPALLSRLSPQRFDDLTKEQQRFYSLFNYVQKALECLACGWPRPLRGLYALIALNASVLASEDIQKQRGTAYSHTVEFLTREQLQALRAILSVDGVRSASLFASQSDSTSDDARQCELAEARTRAILDIYEASHDDLLVRIAKSERCSAGDSLKEDMSLLIPVGTHSSTAAGTTPFLLQFTEDVSLCADLFRALLAQDVATAEQIALTLCATFSHSVLDSRTLSHAEAGERAASPAGRSAVASSRRPGRRATNISSSEALSVSRRRGNSIAASSVAAESVAVSAVRGDLFDLAAQGGVKVHSHLELTELCTRESIAMCVPTNHVGEVLKEVRLRATNAQLSHHWHTVSTAADMEATGATLLTYFHTREMTKKGHWAIVEITARGVTADSARLRALSEATYRVLALYHSRAAHGALGGEVEPVIPVRLTVVCDHGMWALLSSAAASMETAVAGAPTERESVAAPCLVISRGFVTPRYHLLSLLEKDEVQQGCELNPQKKRRADYDDDDGHTALRKPQSAQEADAQQLERFCVLLFKELALLHVSVAEHTRYLRSEWRSVGSGFSQKLEPSLDVEGDDDNLVTFLRVVRGWARRLSRIDGDAWVPEAERSAVPSSFLTTTAGSPVNSLSGRHLDAISTARNGGGADLSGPRSAHRHALNLYRQRRLAWQLMTADGRESQLTNMLPTAFLEEEKATRSSRRQPSQGELMKRHCIHSTYLLFQKIAYLFVARLAEAVSEHVSVLHIIRHRICGPPPDHTAVFVNVDQLLRGTSDLTAQRLNPSAEPQLLRLDAESSLAEFRTEVSRLHSQLLGLAQYPAAVAHYEARSKALTHSLLFGLTPVRTTGATPTAAVVVATPPAACVLPAEVSDAAEEAKADAIAAVEAELAALLQDGADDDASAMAATAAAETSSRGSTSPEPRLAWMLEKAHLSRLHATVLRVTEHPARETAAEHDAAGTTAMATDVHADDAAPTPRRSSSLRAPPMTMSRASRESVAMHMLNTCHSLNGTADSLPSLWLPCLKSPGLAFFFTAFYAHAARDTDYGVGESGELEEADDAGKGGMAYYGAGRGVVLVITQRALLLETDVVLVGARLSPLLQMEVQRVTQWPSDCFRADVTSHTDAQAMVIAARVLRGDAHHPTHPLESVASAEQQLLWGVTPPTQSAADVLTGGDQHLPAQMSTSRPSTARPVVPTESVFVTEISLSDTPVLHHPVPNRQLVQTLTPAPLSVYTKTLKVVDGAQGEDTLQQEWNCVSAEVYGMLEYVSTADESGEFGPLSSPLSADDDDSPDAATTVTTASQLTPHGGSAHFVYIE